MPENQILQLLYRHEKRQRWPTNERGNRKRKTPRSQSVTMVKNSNAFECRDCWMPWRASMGCSPGLENVSGMWRHPRYSLGTLAGALEFYVSSTLELQTSVRPQWLDLPFIINRTLGEKFLCSRYAQCNNFLPGSYINLLPLSELLCLPPFTLYSHSYPTPKFHSSKHSLSSSVVGAFGLFAKRGRRWRRIRKKKMKKFHLCVGSCLHGAIQ